MKKLLYILLLIPMVSCSQDKTLGIRSSRFSILVVSAGESNEPGYGVNSELSSAELSGRKTRIFNIINGINTPLYVGGNNLGTSSSQHGYELQLANAKDSGYFGTKHLYLAKTGQGSTRVSDWARWNTF